MDRLRSLCRVGLFVSLIAVVQLLLIVTFRPHRSEMLWLQLKEFAHDGEAPGFHRLQYFDEHGNAHAYSVFVPHGLSLNEPAPVILFLNGLGENGTDGVMPLTNGLGRAVWENQRFFPFVCVFPQQHPDEDWSPSGTAIQRTLAILQKTEDEYHTDPDRVYLTGVSTGAIAAWALAAAHPERFAALAPVSGVVESGLAAQIAAAGIPVWASFNAEDNPGLVSSNRETHDRLLRHGCSPYLTEIGGTKVSKRDFHDSWNYAFRNGALYSWLLRQNRVQNSSSRLDPFVLHPLDDALREFGNDFVTVPGQTTGDFELHAEFRPGETFVCGFGMFGGQPEDSLRTDLWCSITSSDYGAGGVSFLGSPDHPTVRCSDLALASVVQGAWNDLRVIRVGSQLTIRVNGWELCDTTLPETVTRQVSLALTSASIGTGPAEWRNVRSRGEISSAEAASIEEVNRLVEPLFERKEAPSQVDMKAIATHWQQRQQQAPGKTVSWDITRDGDHLWSPFQSAAALHNGVNGKSHTQISADHAVVVTPWSSPYVECDRIGLNDGLNMHHYNLFRSALRDDKSLNLSSSGYHLSLSSDLKTETVSPGDARDSHLTVLSADAGPRRRPEELFARLPLFSALPVESYGHSILPQNCRIEPHVCSFHGTDCLVLEETPADADFTRRIFVDPQADYRIAGSHSRYNDGTWDRITFDYGESPAALFPDSWTLVATRRGEETFHEYAGQERLLVHGTAQQIERSDRTERPAFNAPSSAVVYDARRRSWFEQTSDGEQTPLTARDARHRLAPETLAASAFSDWSHQRTLVTAIAIIACLLMICRRRRKDANASPVAD